MELRILPPAEADAIKAQLDDKVVVASPRSIATHGVTINVDKKPFDDERVRKALTLAIDRYEMAKTLAPLTGLDTVGHAPGQQVGLKPGRVALPGFGKDHEANLQEAKRLLARPAIPTASRRC